MPKVIDHDRRREEIIAASMKVFGEMGYEDSNLSMVAKECGLSRATLYQYFDNKEELYYCALKSSTENMFQKYAELEWSASDPVSVIEEICGDIVKIAISHENEIRNLLSAVLNMKTDINEAIYRRTVRLQLMLKRMLRQGIRNKTVKNCNVNNAVDCIVAALESYCFQLCYLGEQGAKLEEALLRSYLENLRGGEAR